MDRRVLYATVINIAGILGSLLSFFLVFAASAWLGDRFLGNPELGYMICIVLIGLYGIVYVAYQNAEHKVEMERFREQQLIDRIARTGDQQ